VDAKPSKPDIASFPWDLGVLPFVYRPLPAPTNGSGIPDQEAFTLTIDPRTGTLRRATNPRIASALRKIHLLGSHTTGLMAEKGIGKEYAESFLRFLRRHVGREGFKQRRFLDIGCGSGYLLQRARLLGAEVEGIEPGPQGQEGAGRYRIPIHRDFFPSRKVRGAFDVIACYGVLQNIDDPIEFLGHCRDRLASGGRLFLEVPDSDAYLCSGDISMLTHEHASYFTRETLATTLCAAGFSGATIVASDFGGCLYAVAEPGSCRPSDARTVKQAIAKAIRFRKRVPASGRRIARYCKSARRCGRSLAVVVPGRFVNVLIHEAIPTRDLRFIDDNPLLHGTFFPGIPVPIESRAELLRKPSEEVLVMSKTFGDAIARDLRRRLPRKVRITQWTEFFRADG
jgi:2-polyprenyl-3-methyl-5-hydroxy-6-metoxy-1,4-benzoquinol methylase